MKTLTVRLPERLVAEIDAESRDRRISKSDVIRERLQVRARVAVGRSSALKTIADLIGSVGGLPDDLSARKKKYLKTTGYGRKRPR
jgi:Arc/MetJ-type ribon-helix-helix transcriptional regulator